MKSISALFLAISVTFSVGVQASTSCPTVLVSDPDDTSGGGGISGVGGGGGLGFIVLKYINDIFSDTFPQFIRIVKTKNGTLEACAYDYHLGQDEAVPVHLVAALPCTGGQTMTWPYKDTLRVKCAGPLKNATLEFEATYLKPDRIGRMSRIDAAGSRNTDAILIGVGP